MTKQTIAKRLPVSSLVVWQGIVPAIPYNCRANTQHAQGLAIYSIIIYSEYMLLNVTEL